MSTKKLFLLFIILICTLHSCKNPINKTIADDLSVDDLKIIIQNDTDFIYFYDYLINDCKIHDLMSDKINCLKFGDITYKQLYSYYNTIEEYQDYIWNENASSPLKTKIQNRVDEEWYAAVSPYEQRLDSIINFWRNMKEKDTLDGIDISGLCLLSTLVPYNYFVSVHSPIPIGDLHYKYYIKRKPDLAYKAPLYANWNYSKGEGFINCENKKYHSYLTDLDLPNGFYFNEQCKNFSKENSVYFVLLDYVSNGKRYYSVISEMPSSVAEYFDEEILTYDTNFSIKTCRPVQSHIIREFYNDDFIDYDIFFEIREHEEMMKIDEKCFELLEMLEIID